MGIAKFMERFVNSNAVFLPHLTSDHCPAGLVMPNVMQKRKNKK